MKILITGSNGLIGSEAVRFFCDQGHYVYGIDNNMRAVFFGPEGDTQWCRTSLSENYNNYTHLDLDIRDREAILVLFGKHSFDAIIHCAAQPSHDKARDIPFLDFEVNALGTLNLLEATRNNCKDSPFIFMSTNKVYGDKPNTLNLTEKATRWDYADNQFKDGIPENFDVDQSKHSLFGASKLAADIMVQEYGRYFGMKTCCLRGGCLTGPAHSGVELHGFLSYLVKCNLEEREYTVFGYKGKQVRDNIHAVDVISFMQSFINKPTSASVYNLGGGLDNSISIIEAFEKVSSLTGKTMKWSYCDTPRIGDHICYYSDLKKIKKDYPEWSISMDLNTTILQIIEAWQSRLTNPS